MLHDMFGVGTYSIEQACPLGVQPVQSDKIQAWKISDAPPVAWTAACYFGRLITIRVATAKTTTPTSATLLKVR